MFNLGFVYLYIKNEVMILKFCYGVGVLREFGGFDDSWVFEVLFGFDYMRKLIK